MNLNYAEFYITNVCNLNCPNCNRFNNFAFSGHSRWNDYVHHYEKWAKILKINDIGIIGGEPMLNPDFMSWLHGIRELWPDSKIKIITNGTQLYKFPDFYDYCAKNSSHIRITVSYHGLGQKQKVLKDINNWLQGPIQITHRYDNPTVELWRQSWEKIRAPEWPDYVSPENFVDLPDWMQKECRDTHDFSPEVWQNEVCPTVFKDANGVKITATIANSFVPSTVLFDPILEKMTLHNSNPQQALDVCFSKTCHHFIRGRLYKCGPVGILPEFVRQFKVDISDNDRQLLDSYQAAEPDWDHEKLEHFMDNLINEQVIPQCKFCPSIMNTQKFEAGTKKIKLVKID